MTIKEFRDACERNGYLVPEAKSRLCSREFLQDVRTGKVFVPKIKELKCAPCPNPPILETIRSELLLCLRTGITQIAVY